MERQAHIEKLEKEVSALKALEELLRNTRYCSALLSETATGFLIELAYTWADCSWAVETVGETLAETILAALEKSRAAQAKEVNDGE